MLKLKKNPLKAEKIPLKRLLHSKNISLVHEMYDVYHVCFSGWNREQFIQYLHKLGPSSIVYLIRFQDKIVGYNITLIEEHQIRHKKCYTISGEWALLPKYRNGFKNLFYSAQTSLFFLLRHPFTTLLYIDVIMNYRIYRTLYSIMNVKPNPRSDIPPEYQQILKDFTSQHGFDLEENGYAVNTYDNSASNVSQNEKKKDEELYDYFMEKTYKGTRGLVVIKPLNLKVIMWVIINSFRRPKRSKSP